MNIYESLDMLGYGVMVLLASFCAVQSFRRARESKTDAGNLRNFFYQIAGFYCCICMSDAFFLLTWIVEDYPFVFSPGDISWVGAMLFLITAMLDLKEGWSPLQRKAAQRYRFHAFVAPVVCIAFNIVYIKYYPEIVVNYLLYAVPTILLSYHALQLYLVESNTVSEAKTNRFSKRSSFYLAVLIWLVVQLFYDLFNTLGWEYGYDIVAVICSWLLIASTIAIFVPANMQSESALIDEEPL